VTRHDDVVPVLCAGCLEWYPVRALKVNNGHPYCVRCFPNLRVVRADTGGEVGTSASGIRGSQHRGERR